MDKVIVMPGFPPTFNAPGQICHEIGSLFPEANEQYRFLQVYFIGVAKEENVITPPIPIIPTDLPFQFERVQLPVKLSFAVTINKAQCQTLQRYWSGKRGVGRTGANLETEVEAAVGVGVRPRFEKRCRCQWERGRGVALAVNISYKHIIINRQCILMSVMLTASVTAYLYMNNNALDTDVKAHVCLTLFAGFATLHGHSVIIVLAGRRGRHDLHFKDGGATGDRQKERDKNSKHAQPLLLEVICVIWYTGYHRWHVSVVVLGSSFFHPRKSGCLISGYADGGLEVHSVPLLRQPQPAIFPLTYLPALPTAEVCRRCQDLPMRN
ncbi:hypothetical protein EVAR_68720_1 [Eumeta japonica]|uniref:ATP-dependent DNA helicase n=1 Tax=Eumeta variegata TaxID=151549 RepID=A0A4C2A3V6_EUMVA|nr:hypothetical protein EVAR_68720_1 [Eumeta japonica]